MERKISKISIIGASGHAKVVCSSINNIDSMIDMSFFDSDPDKIGKIFIKNKIIQCQSTYKKEKLFHIAIGNNKIRKNTYAKYCKDENEFFIVVHPKSFIDQEACIGPGTFLAAYSIVGPSSVVGKGVIVNHSAIIDHDCNVGNWSHIAPNATLGGGVIVGEGVLVGAGATILPGLKIGDWSIIGAGAVVLDDVPSNQTYVGNPAKRIV